MQFPSDIRVHQATVARFTGDRGPWLEHLVEDEGMSFEQAMETLAPWKLIPFHDENGTHMGTLLKDKKEVHFAGYRKYRYSGNITAKRLAEFFQPILDAEVFLVTKIDPKESSRFIEHLGFQEMGVAGDGVRTFILNDIKYPEVKTCNN